MTTHNAWNEIKNSRNLIFFQPRHGADNKSALQGKVPIPFPGFSELGTLCANM